MVVNERGTGKGKAEILARAAAIDDEAMEHLAAKRYDASIRCFTDAIRLDPLNMRAHLGRDVTNLLKATYDGTTAGLLRARPGRTTTTEETE